MKLLTQLRTASAVLIASASVFGAVWTGGGDGTTWADGANWDTGIVPSSTTDVTVDAAGSVSYNIGGNWTRGGATNITGNTVLSITGKRFLSGADGSAMFSISGNAQVTNSGDYCIVGAGSSASVFSMSGGTFNASVNRGFFIADNAYCSGSMLNITGGSFNVTYVAQNDDFWNEFIGHSDGDGTMLVKGGTVNIAAASNLDNRRIYIRQNGLIQIDAGVVNFTNMKYFIIGKNYAEDQGKVILNGGALNITTTAVGGVVVGGENSNGLLELNGGALTVNSPNGIWIGDGGDSISGTVRQNSGDVSIVGGGGITIGRVSTPLSIYEMNGGTLNCSYIVLGESALAGSGFVFNAGEIILAGDQRDIVNQSWFQVAADAVVEYDSVNDVTNISYLPYAINPVPASGTVDQGILNGTALEMNLAWTTGLGAGGTTNADITSHEVYVANVSADPNVIFEKIATVPATGDSGSYGPFTVDYGTNYRWRVDEVTPAGTITGQVWEFRTVYSLPTILSIQPANALYPQGATATITAQYSSATPATNVNWYVDGTPVNTADSNITIGLTATTATLTITSMAPEYDGVYTCVISNDGGNSEVSAGSTVECEQLMAWYAFGGDFTDSQNDFDGTLINEDPNFPGGTFADGVDGQAVVFENAKGEYVQVPRMVQDNMTIEMWFKTTLTGGTGGWWNGYGLVDSEYPGSTNDFGSSVLGSKFAFGIGSNTGDITLSSTSDVNDDQWHHCVATRDSATGQIKIYVDGHLETTGSGNPGSKNVNDVIAIGTVLTYPVERVFTGAIDEVKLYNYILSDLEIAAIYNGVTGEVVCVEDNRPSGTYDINGDCIVDVADFAAFATGWLDCGLYPSCIN
ncbi:MAG: LamG-like jellyroll fold domain-containing protein [Phycisphaerae bacterium]